MEKGHDHWVQVDPAGQRIRVFRAMPNGSRVLFTEYALPEDTGGWTASVAELARTLGEDLLMDAPAIRRRLRL